MAVKISNHWGKAAYHGLFTTGNMKTRKGEKLGYLTLILHLSPYTDNSLGVNLCPHSTSECVAYCLHDSGHSELQGYGTIKKARRRKSDLFLADRRGFLEKLAEEIRYYENRVIKKGLKLAVRLNGTADIQWSKVKDLHGKNIFETFPDVHFYDYTKDPKIVEHGNLYENYHITFSWSGQNLKQCLKASGLGCNIAVPFQGVLPTGFMGLPVFNGEETDLRFLDPYGCVVGLKVKGRKQKKVGISQFLVSIEKVKT